MLSWFANWDAQVQIAELTREVEALRVEVRMLKDECMVKDNGLDLLGKMLEAMRQQQRANLAFEVNRARAMGAADEESK